MLVSERVVLHLTSPAVAIDFAQSMQYELIAGKFKGQRVLRSEF